MTATAAPTLAQYLDRPLAVGEPDVVGPLVVFPLFGPPPRADYVAFAQATDAVSVHELEDGASVNDLVVVNGAAAPVLLYDGQEVLGAQQNRTFDVTVLVAAGAKLRVPVSCVEQGRWDDRRHGEAFAPAPQMAYPELRRSKARSVRAAAAAGMQARADQGEVWEHVARKSRRMGVRSETGAMHDIYESRRSRLRDLCGAVRLHDGQVGALAAIGGRLAVMDQVSRPEVFATLHEPLVHGYALDALEVQTLDPPVPSLGAAETFVEAVCDRPLAERAAIGLGRDAHFESAGLAGAGLVVDDELVQLTAFAEENGSGPAGGSRRTRIRRPSHRRAL